MRLISSRISRISNVLSISEVATRVAIGFHWTMSVAVDEWVAVTPFCVVVAVMVMVEFPLGVPGTVCFELPPHAIGPHVKVSRKRGNNIQRYPVDVLAFRFKP
jgi:hypothetical protein